MLDVALEVARIEMRAPHRFVDSTKLGDRELRRAEHGREGCVLQLGPRPLDGVPHDPLVVKRQSNRAPLDRLHWCQHCGQRVPTAPERREIGADCPVGDGDDAHARIPVRRTVAGELLQVPGAVAQTRFLGQFAGHHDSRVASRCRARGVRLLYLPPYSPDLNPIEAGWALQKQHLRKYAPRSPDNLRRVARRARYRITPHHCHQWFAHAGYQAQLR